MMAGNPNWWSMNGMHPRDSYSPSDDHRTSDGQDFPVRSWSQLLLGASAGGGGVDVYSGGLFQQEKKLESWEEQRILNMNNIPSPISRVSDVKQESGYDGFPAAGASSCGWPPPAAAVAASSPTSCITNSILNFSAAKNQEQSYEGTSGGVSNKKARVQQSSAQPVLKVRKEKLGDRITALHQLVSPFGKTDTASVLSEAIGYIRFLQGQIEALSSPHMRNSTRFGHHGMEKGASYQDLEGQQPNLRSRGLCLVPVSCTYQMATDGGSGGIDYWPLAALGGGF